MLRGTHKTYDNTIINLSIKLDIVPQLHKEARIVPLYKKDALNLCVNHRPVSLLASLSKILEKAICRQLMQYLNVEKLICPDQFVFRRSNQTTNSLGA